MGEKVMVRSSCITVFSDYSEALTAKDLLKKINLKDDQIVLLDKSLKHESIRTDIDEYFNQIGVPEDIMHCYRCQLQSGSFLLIASGTSHEIEQACQLLEMNDYSSSVHFNTEA